MAETSRPKVLVFFYVCGDCCRACRWLLKHAGYGQPGVYDCHGCRRLPLDGGKSGSHAATRGFLVGVEASGFTSPYPPVMPQDDRGRCDRHPSVDPGGVAHGHHGCLWATLPGSISIRSFIPWSLRFAELTRGYRAMKPPASLPAQTTAGISLYSIGSWGHTHGTLRMQPPVLRLQPPVLCILLHVLCLLPRSGWSF